MFDPATKKINIMKSLKKSIEKSFFSADFHKFITLNVDETHMECYEKLKSDIQQKLFESTREIIKAVEKLLSRLQHPDGECLTGMLEKPKHGNLLNGELLLRIRNLESLITGLMFCYAIENENELETHKEIWSKCAGKPKDDNHLRAHHYAVYEQFKKVKSVDKMDEFNAFFRKYISDLLFELADEIRLRLQFDFKHFETQPDFLQFLNKLLGLVEMAELKDHV
jgi:hypothetical protein